MGDAAYLARITANVPPVTDNYPARISSELVGNVGRVPLYAAVMDERDRLARFENSEFISQVWPPEFARATAPYFRYEGLIMDHFTAGDYPPAAPAIVLESVDDVLTNSTLETLPLWLLGTDRDVQRNVQALAALIAERPDVAMEFTIGKLVQRDFAGALRIHEASMSAAHSKASVSNLTLLLYLLAKNGRADEARTLIENIDVQKTPEIRSFVEWFGKKFPR